MMKMSIFVKSMMFLIVDACFVSVYLSRKCQPTTVGAEHRVCVLVSQFSILCFVGKYNTTLK